MICFPNAKINLGLQIIEKLPNGYHAINSCFYPIPVCDALEFVEAKKTTFSSSGIDIPGDATQNLVLQAYKLLKKDFQLPHLNIHLLKNIPIGAGLGGGSADGAYMLKALNEHFQLYLDDSFLETYAEQLGSDCPFFISNQPAIATGTGTELKAIALDLSGMWMVLVNPGIHISTQQAYAGVSPQPSSYVLDELIFSKDLKLWREMLVNDFEQSIFKIAPEVAQLKDELYEMGAGYSSMTGSGSSVFGLFKEEPKLEIDQWSKYFHRVVQL